MNKCLKNLLPLFAMLGVLPIYGANLTSPVQSGNVVPGSGYSNDSEQIAPQICYNGYVSSVTSEHGRLELDTALSFSELEHQLNVNVEATVGIGEFSASAEASYLHSIEDKNYSLSLNYLEYSDAKVAIGIKGQGIGALNSQGKLAYNDGKNIYFGLACGDNYLDSYKKGALLTIGLNINFASSEEKKQFETKIKGNFGSIVSASTTIQEMARKYKLNGSITLTAFQEGGTPEKLGQIMKKDPKGEYYILHCNNIQNMGDFIKAAGGVLDYAHDSDKFPSQYSLKNNRNITPLGLGFATYQDIRLLSLTPPSSFVTPEVTKARKQLHGHLNENIYYRQKLHDLLYGYYVNWDTGNDIYKKISRLYQRSQNNLDTIENPAPQYGAIGCYTKPYDCIAIAENIKENLEPITQNDLSTLNPIRTYMSGPYTAYYYNGTSWRADMMHNSGECYLLGINSIAVTPEHFSLTASAHCPGVDFTFWYNGTSTDGSKHYIGPYYNSAGTRIPNMNITRLASPFAVDQYQPPAANATGETLGFVQP